MNCSSLVFPTPSVLLKNRIPFFLLLLAFGALAIGCAGSSRGRVPDLSTTSPRLIQQRIAHNFRKMESFEGKARVIIEVPGEGHYGYSNIYIKFPDSVFVKTESGNLM